MSFRRKRIGTLLRNCVSDEFRRRLERRVEWIHQYLRDNSHDLSLDACFSHRVLYRLLNHVSDPSGSARDENAERQRRSTRADSL